MSALLNKGPQAKAISHSHPYKNLLAAILLVAVPQLVDAQPLPHRVIDIATPNVRISNQSELGSRAHPFAVYLATVHRQIHHFWADGFLAELDHAKSAAYARATAQTKNELNRKL